LIQWAKQKGIFVKVDRDTDWGNPFLLTDDGTRDEVCDHYTQYLEWKPSLRKKIPEVLKGKVLGCWCYPNRCHGQHLASLADKPN
jgi:hypothetical protein